MRIWVDVVKVWVAACMATSSGGPRMVVVW